MDVRKQVVDSLLALADIKVGGSNPWDIKIYDERTYEWVLKSRNLGLGEAYMEGFWECERIDEFIYRILKARLDEKVKENLNNLLLYLFARLFNLQSRRRAHQVAEEHYDLGNDLFTSFLDPYLQYSCAYFRDTEDLAQAQINKMELLCTKMELKATDHVLDIGCGWGGLAKYMAERYGCSVVGINISTEQIRFAREFCKDLPVEIRYSDYRDVSGNFDKVVSVGMFEHVGQKNYRIFMEKVHQLLKDGGIFVLQTIGGNKSTVNCDAWIAKYIFPNGMLPSIAQIGKAVEGLFVIEDWHNLGPHYDKTLISWHKNFVQAWPKLKENYSERFRRMWEYYLLSCAGAFRARHIQLWQIIFTKIGTPQPRYCHR